MDESLVEEIRLDKALVVALGGVARLILVDYSCNQYFDKGQWRWSLILKKMTLNEYLMYEARHRVLTRRCISRKRGACSKVSPARIRILVYPDFDEEDEEYCSLPPLLPCFQTPQPCTKFDSTPHNVKNEVDIDRMTLDEYDLYMAMQYTIDSSIEEILDELFRVRAECLRRIEHEVLNRMMKTLFLAQQRKLRKFRWRTLKWMKTTTLTIQILKRRYNGVLLKTC
ncbi:hypothetical protein Tco_1209799 [Tanacetum coccineum]